MGIKKIDELEKALDQLKKELEVKEKEFQEKLEAVQKTRKTAFSAKDEKENIDALKAMAADMHFKSVLLGKDISEMPGYKELSEKLATKSIIVPADLPNWAYEQFSTRLLEELEPELKLESLFPHIRIPDGVSSFSIPGVVDNTKAYLIAPAQDAIQSAIASAKVTFQTDRIKTLVGVADQAYQESVTALAQIVRDRLIMSIVKATEELIVLGDKTIADANDVKKADDGLLKLAKDAGNVVDNGGGAITAQILMEARKKLGLYGANLSEVVIIAPLEVAYQMISLPEVVSVDKYGANATILKGELGRIWGMPIVVTDYLPTNLQADGTNDGSGDKTAVLVANPNYFVVADRGGITFETERKAVSSTDLYVGFRDIAFGNIAINSTPVVAVTNVQP